LVKINSRDTTFKLMNRLWTRARRELPADLVLGPVVVTQELPLAAELDFEEEFIPDDDDLSSDSDVAIEASPLAADAIDSSYLVKRMSQTSGALYYHQGSISQNSISAQNFSDIFSSLNIGPITSCSL
jgi:hypothetical protein